MPFVISDEQYQTLKNFMQGLQEEFDHGWWVWAHKRSMDQGQSWIKTNRGEVYAEVSGLLATLTPVVEEEKRRKNAPTSAEE